MQIVDRRCRHCGDSIGPADNARGCPDCGIIAHTECLAGPSHCPQCEQPFAAVQDGPAGGDPPPPPEPPQPDPLADVDPSEAPPPGRWLLYLFFRPRAFFRHFALDTAHGLMGLACYLYGLAVAIDRLSERAARETVSGRPGLWSQVAEDWSAYWTICLLTGTLSALLVWSLGGWWYRVRLGLAGAVRPDAMRARRVYVFASLVWAIPNLLQAVWETATYASPREAFELAGLEGFLPLGFVLWSVLVSYRGATTTFVLRRGGALLWFLILPLAVYAAAFAAVFVLFSTGIARARPDVAHPRIVDRPAFQLIYPGNWRIDTTDPDYHPDHYFSVQPPFADCAVFVHLGRDFASAEDAVAAYRQGLESAFEIGSWSPLSSWGPLRGEGLSSVGHLSGKGRYRIELFATRVGDAVLCVRELCDADHHDGVEPGLRMIRERFRLK